MTIRAFILAIVLSFSGLAASGTVEAAPGNGLLAVVSGIPAQAFVDPVQAFTDTAAGIALIRTGDLTPRLVTHTLPGVAEPAWSPSGRRVALTLGKAVVLVNADGTGLHPLRRPTDALDRAPAWSSRGQLAFIRTDIFGEGARLIVAHADGRGQRTLLPTQLRLEGSPVWSRDGLRVLLLQSVTARWAHVIDVATGHITVRRLPRECTAIPVASPRSAAAACIGRRGERTSLWLINPRGTRELATGVREAQPAWSPDGERIAYATASDRVTVQTVATGRSRTFAMHARSTPDNFYRDGPQPSWSPDGRHLVAGRTHLGWRVGILDTRTGGVRTLLQHTHDASPRWSPDGLLLAYIHETGSGDAELRIRPLAGSAWTVAHHLRTHGRTTPYAWSPDSRTLVVISAAGDLSIVAADASGSRILAAGACCSPAWSPEGTTIAYTTSAVTIALIAADGSPDHPPAPPGLGFAPQWSPDGSLLLYVIPASAEQGTARLPLGSTALWTFATQGITPVGDPGAEVTRGVFSPDGSQFHLTYGGTSGPNGDIFFLDGRRIPTGGTRSFAWSPAGDLIAMEASDSVYVWRPTAGGVGFQDDFRYERASDPSWQPVPK